MDIVIRRWWMLELRGMASFALAVVLLLLPGWDSSAALALAFGAYAIVDGAGTQALVRRARGFDRTAFLGRAALGFVAGVFMLSNPSAPTAALWVAVSVWAIGTGGLEVIFGSRAWTTLPKPVGFMVAGMMSLGLGLTAIHFALETPGMLRGFLIAYGVGNGVVATMLGESLHAPARQTV